VKPGVRYEFGYFPERVSAGTRHEQAVSAADYGMGNPGGLFGCLPLAKNDFRKSLASGPVVIDARKAQILNRGVGEGVLGAGGRSLGTQGTGPDLLEEIEQALVGAGSGIRMIAHGYSFDSVERGSLELSPQRRRRLIL
jgi:hypothetical protein